MKPLTLFCALLLAACGNGQAYWYQLEQDRQFKCAMDPHLQMCATAGDLQKAWQGTD